MDKQSAILSVTAEKQACIAFLNLKKDMGDWVEVANYAQKILMADEKLRLLNSITEVSNGIPDAQALIRREAQALATKRAQNSERAAAAQRDLEAKTAESLAQEIQKS